MVNRPLDLDAIEARANAATPGPWQVDTTEINADIIATGAWVARTDGCNEDAASANAAFIAASRTDVVALVAAVRRLTAELDRLQAATAAVSGA